MSDIRAQSRRDAEFERLADEIIRDLGGMSEAEIYESFRKLHEMGKRHGAEQCQKWVSHPDCFGAWLAVFVAPDGSWQDTLRVNVKRGESVAEGTNWRYYGPIPADEVKP